MKKLLSILLALVLVLSLATTAFAATAQVTITGVSGRDYEAFKLLNASVSGTNYAYEVNTKYTEVLIEVLGLDATATGEDIITEIGKITNTEAMRHFADKLYKAILAAGLAADATWSGETVDLEQAYWLIADVTDLSGTSSSNSLVMVDTVGDTDITVAAKPDTPDTVKKIDDENDSLIDPSPISEDATNLQDSADYDIGDRVPYVITTNLPNNISEYSYYSILLRDEVDKGLTYLPDSFAITVNGKPMTIAEAGTDATADFVYVIETTTDADGKQTAQNLYVYPNRGYTLVEKDALGNPVEVAASKTAGGDFLALFPADTDHSAINFSEVVFSYECELNAAAVIGNPGNPNFYELVFSNDPYSDSFGQTPRDVCIVFTYQVIFNKVDSHQDPLEGADFDLFKFVAIAGADAYTEETAPAGAIFHNGANAWGYWQNLTNQKTTNKVADDPATPEDESKEATTFTFTGLDDGFYKLEETIVPLGYNGIDPIEFYVSAEHDTDFSAYVESGILTALNATTKVSGELALDGGVNGILEATVENRSGTELPTTGGMGTTMFYVLGTMMVMGTAVLMVTRKRMTAFE